MERTFVMIKPDAVQRSLIGRIITTFEESGLKIVAMRMMTPSREIATKHYPDTPAWCETVGKKTLEGYALVGRSVQKDLGTEDPIEIGKLVKGWLVSFLTGGKVVAMVLEGNSAVKNVRRICGATLPILADPGSIRGRFSLDSPDCANVEKRPVLNLIHASGDLTEAAFEIKLWFSDLA